MTATRDLPAAASTGSVLGGKYRVERVLGRGGMGVVLLATHLELQKRVAVKLLLAESSPTLSSRFKREAQVAAQLASPHVAQVLDFGVSDGLAFLVMEYLEGHDLEAELQARRRIPVPEAVDLVLEGCVGIALAHAAGLVHRDLKPANLFLARSLSGKRTVKVLDFGLIKDASSDAQSLTASAEVFGTPQYMAPEQIQSSKNVDARCDQHALALILFELCAGSPAYRAESLPHLIVVIATHPPPSLSVTLPGAPAGLSEVLIRAMSKRPGERFPHLGAFAAALAPFGGPRAAELAAEIGTSLGAPRPPPGPAATPTESGTAMMQAPPPGALITQLPPTAAASSPPLPPTHPTGPSPHGQGSMHPTRGAVAPHDRPAPQSATWAVGTEPSFNGSVPAMSHPVGATIPSTESRPRSSAALVVGVGASVLGLLVVVSVVLAMTLRTPTATGAAASSAVAQPSTATSEAPEPAVARPIDSREPDATPSASASAPSAPPSAPSSRPKAPASPPKPPATPAARPPATRCTGLACY